VNVRHFLERKGIRYVYHFTDVENLPSIRRYGLLPHNDLEDSGILPVKPGGDERSRASDSENGLAGFVHLCFKSEHPMEYIARQDGRLGQTRFLRVAAEVLLRRGVLGCATLANRLDAKILPLGDALEQMDIEILFSDMMDFGNPALVRRFNEARKAEILVPGEIPVDQIANLA
jgi:hypothetical protein